MHTWKTYFSMRVCTFHKMGTYCLLFSYVYTIIVLIMGYCNKCILDLLLHRAKTSYYTLHDKRREEKSFTRIYTYWVMRITTWKCAWLLCTWSKSIDDGAHCSILLGILWIVQSCLFFFVTASTECILVSYFRQFTKHFFHYSDIFWCRFHLMLYAIALKWTSCLIIFQSLVRGCCQFHKIVISTFTVWFGENPQRTFRSFRPHCTGEKIVNTNPTHMPLLLIVSFKIVGFEKKIIG